MASVKMIRVGYGITVNLGNFQSARVDYGLEIALGPGDTPANTAPQYFDEVRQEVRRMARPLLAAKDSKIDQIWVDLPPEVRQQMSAATNPNRAQQPWQAGDGADIRAGHYGSQQGE